MAPDWVARELKWIARADRAGLPLLGICFGAQALALALGGSVKPLDVPEFSWIEVGEHPEFASGPWLALHEDTITIPDAAAELARNDSGCQAFTIRAHLGVQFHPEVTPAILAAWIAANGERLAHVRAELLADVRTRCQSAAAAAFDLLDGFASRASVAGEPALSAGAYSR